MEDNKDMTIDDICNQPVFSPQSGLDPSKTSIIKVVGVGGGGNNAINHMYKQGIEHVSFVVCNTDQQALNNSPVPTKVLLGHTGLGAGNKPEVAKAAAEESIEKINELFDDDTRMVFITAGLGGGTGTGAAPIVAKVAKERGVLTIGIVTIPFLFEGDRKIYKALDGADEMSKYVDALLIINNDRLAEIYPDLDFINAFGKADDTLSIAARSISEIITCDGHINLDFNDVDTTLRDGGAAIISTGFGDGDRRVTNAIQDALNSPLLKNRNIMGSKRLLFNLYFSRDAERKFQMSEIQELNKFISSIDSQVDVIWGVGYDESLGEKVKITILAAGFETNTTPKKTQELVVTPTDPAGGNTVQQKPDLTGIYDEKRVKDIQLDRQRASYVILSPDQFDDDAVVEKLERTPAYKREKHVAEQIKAISSRNNPETPPTPPPASHSSSGPAVIDFSAEA